MKSLVKKWSSKYNSCIKCGATNIPHTAKGLCKKCYNLFIENKHKTIIREKRGAAEKFLTKEVLEKLYINQKKSLSEIGIIAKTTRQNVYYKLKRYNIKIRSKISARQIALDEGKLTHSHISREGEYIEKILYKIKYNESFFSSWSNEMAYVLGLLYTDGNLQDGEPNNPKRLLPRLSFAQKDKELVLKVIELMGCNVRISESKTRKYKHTTATELYYFHLYSQLLFDQLSSLGLNPKKSLNLTFPEIPYQYVPHFIRGCWDGDGTVYLESKNHRLRAGIVSGSRHFIEGIIKHLYDFGLSKRTVYMSNNAFYIRYSSKIDCQLLFEYLYKGSNDTTRFSRKYQIFYNYFEK